MPMEQGLLANTHLHLARLGNTHFKQLFKAPPRTPLADIIRIAGHFPRFLEPDMKEDIIKAITMGELESTLKWFKKYKSLGWSVEFCLTFFDIIGLELLGVVEESHLLGRIFEPINSTYIALISNTESPLSFNDFRPISLCNCLYKIIAKIIANRIKPILSDHISPKQFSFLQNRQIHEAIGTTQEALHSIKLKKLKGVLLKIDLSKAFDIVSWLYLRMIPTHLRFPLFYIRWIMCCITFVSFTILINGSTSHSFWPERGIRQGCPLSPLLLLLVMEGLTRLILLEK